MSWDLLMVKQVGKELPRESIILLLLTLICYFKIESWHISKFHFVTMARLLNLQGILFFDRMTDEVLDSIRTELEVSTTFYMFYILQ